MVVRNRPRGDRLSSMRKDGALGALRWDPAWKEFCSGRILPGLAFAVARRGVPERVESYGWADLEVERAWNGASEFLISSLTKTMVAVAIMQLIEEGSLDLDAHVSDLLPRPQLCLPGNARCREVTLRHLLTHTSGLVLIRRIDRFFPGSGISSPMRRGAGPPTRHLPDELKLRWRPGERFHYSSLGFELAARALQAVAAEPWWRYIQRRLLQPLGMVQTRLASDLDAPRYRLVGYDPHRGALLRAKQHHILLEGAAGVQSAISDMAWYAAALSGGGSSARSRILSRGGFDCLIRDQQLRAKSAPRLGLGWGLARVGGHDVAWHGGGWPGFASSLWILPAHSACVTILVNRTRWERFDLDCLRVVGRLLELDLG